MPGTSQSHSTVSDDPFDEALKPPPNESAEERALRMQREEQAKQISVAIDASIKAERQARKKKRIVRLLLLGQSESGKSTTLRQFQRLYTPTAFREERILWRAIIQLNIVRSIRIILETLDHPSSPQGSPKISPQSHHRNFSNTTRRLQRESHANPIASTSTDTSMLDDYYYTDARNGYSNGHVSPESDPDSDSQEMYGASSGLIHNPASLETLKMRLLPLRHIEALLVAKLVPPNEDEATQLPGRSQSQISVPYRNQEIFVRPGAMWKGALARARVHYPSAHVEQDCNHPANGRPLSAGNVGLETADEPQEVLNSCRQDMMLLWADLGVRSLLHRRKIRLEEFPGFFLNDLERVTSLKYMPNDDDVLKARLKTVGVAEYKFEMEVSTGRETGTDWRIVDVGGSRSQRQTWVPFFDDVDAIIFLAPISAFDQVLTEDRTVNRLEDSVLLWKSVCSNKLLANVDLVLFLNKCDILDSKLKAGIKLSKYVRSYGDRPNDMENVSKYLRGKFSAIHREYSPNPRKFYAFCTSVTDTATTAGIIASVRDMVIRQHLKQSRLM